MSSRQEYRGVLAAVAITAVTAFASVARAQADVATAEALFREGKRLMEQKSFAAACPKLKESFAQDEATGTLLALALCHQGRFDEAGDVPSVAWDVRPERWDTQPEG